jgi:hypothetical protein
MSYSFPSTQTNTTNLDAGTKSPAAARPDILAAIQNLNNLLLGLGVAGGFAKVDANGNVVLGTGLNFGINGTSGFPRLTLSATAYLEFNTTTNAWDYYLSGVKKGSMPFATPATNSYTDLLNKPTFGALGSLGVGLGLTSDGTNLNLNTGFLQGLLAMPMCGMASCASAGQGINNYNQVANYFTVIFDTTGNNVANKFTCPTGQAGTYYFKFITPFSQGVALLKNGSSWASSGTGTVSGTVTLAVGDYVQPYYTSCNNGENNTPCGSKGFGGYRIS